jgi:hypothetical protein
LISQNAGAAENARLKPILRQSIFVALANAAIRPLKGADWPPIVKYEILKELFT